MESRGKAINVVGDSTIGTLDIGPTPNQQQNLRGLRGLCDLRAYRL
jgi:hypothetical protein